VREFRSEELLLLASRHIGHDGFGHDRIAQRTQPNGHELRTTLISRNKLQLKCRLHHDATA